MFELYNIHTIDDMQPVFYVSKYDVFTVVALPSK